MATQATRERMRHEMIGGPRSLDISRRRFSFERHLIAAEHVTSDRSGLDAVDFTRFLFEQREGYRVLSTHFVPYLGEETWSFFSDGDPIADLTFAGLHKQVLDGRLRPDEARNLILVIAPSPEGRLLSRHEVRAAFPDFRARLDSTHEA